MTTIVRHPQVRHDRRRPAGPPDAHSGLTCDGSPLQLRPARAEDRQAIEALFERMSPRSLRQRFLTASMVSAREYVADLDDPGRTLDAALVVWRGEVVAVGSTHRVSQTAAEVALAIDDAHQRHGLGTLVLGDLVARARARGLLELVALTLASNDPMLRVFDHMGLPMRVDSADGTCAVTLQLDEQAGPARPAAGRASLTDGLALQPFLRPRSVAVVGAGVQRDGVGRQVVQRLQHSDFAGRVYVVNPSGEVVGRTASFRAVADLPEAVDLAVIAVPGDAVTTAVREATAAGSRAVAVLGGGPSADPDTVRGEDLRASCRAAGARFLGPDIIGLVNTDPRVRLDASFLHPSPAPGPVCVVADSWALTTAIVARLGMSGTGVSTVVNLGGARGEISAVDALSFAAADPRTSLAVVCVGDEGELAAYRPGERPGSRGALPVLLLTTSGSATDPSGEEDDPGLAAGVVRVGSLTELVDTADLLAKAGPPAGRRVAVLGNAGGSGRLALQAVVRHGLLPADLSQHADRRLSTVLPPGASVGPAVDATSAATIDQLRKALMAVAEDPGVDAVVAQITALPHLQACEIGHLLDEVAQVNPSTSIVSAVQDTVCTGPQRAPTIPDPERAVAALAHALEVRVAGCRRGTTHPRAVPRR
jgi:succinyl-CoA synthetase alpha subunit/GNAT superfamily N-acetyltransferase